MYAWFSARLGYCVSMNNAFSDVRSTIVVADRAEFGIWLM